MLFMCISKVSLVLLKAAPLRSKVYLTSSLMNCERPSMEEEEETFENSYRKIEAVE